MVISFLIVCRNRLIGEPCTSLLSFQLTNSCIVFYNYMENWFDARDDCLFRGGDLAVLTDGDQQILKYSTRGNFPHIRFWIGLTSISWSWMVDIESTFQLTCTHLLVSVLISNICLSNTATKLSHVVSSQMKICWWNPVSSFRWSI